MDYGTESAPGQAQAVKYAEFMSRQDHSQATIVFYVESSLLYQLGKPEDTIVV